MRISFRTMNRADRETLTNLVIGYESDALSGIDIPQQVFRLQRWRRQGWSLSVYHSNILAMFIGYARAKAHV